MSTPFQNRLVGTVIVAAAIIIFLPDILDGEKETNQADFEAIPQAPAFQPKHSNTPFPEEKLTSIPQEPVVNQQADDDDYQASLLARKTDIENVAVEPVTKEPVTKVSVDKEPTTRSTSSQPKSTDKVEPALTTRNAWVIHLGSFKHKKNVEQLMKTLKSNGYTAFTQPIKTKKGTLTKVIVGPSLNKANLEKNISKLKDLTTVQGKIARFKVTK